MSDATNIELARRLLVALDAGDAAVVEELVHPGYREHAIGWLEATFADRETVVEDLIASGDRVVARVRFSAAPGVVASQVHIWRVADGRLAEHWMTGDDLRQDATQLTTGGT